MAPALIVVITKLLVNQQVDDAVGSWTFVVATGVEQFGNTPVQLSAMKRETLGIDVSLGASTLTATILFPTQSNSTQDSITIQGLHDLRGSDNETGSVSAASALYAAYIGGNFSFDHATGTLTIQPREWAMQ